MSPASQDVFSYTFIRKAEKLAESAFSVMVKFAAKMCAENTMVLRLNGACRKKLGLKIDVYFAF